MGPIERIEQAFINSAPAVPVMPANQTARRATQADETRHDADDASDDGSSTSGDLMGAMDLDMFHGKRKFRQPTDEDEDEDEDSEDDEEQSSLPTCALLRGLIPSPSAVSQPSGTGWPRADEPVDEVPASPAGPTPDDSASAPTSDAANAHETEPDAGAERAETSTLAPVVETDGGPAPEHATASHEPLPPELAAGLPQPPASRRTELVSKRRLRAVPQTNHLASLPPAVVEILNTLMAGSSAPSEDQHVRHVLARFGRRILALCKGFGTRVLWVAEPPSQVVPILQKHGDRHYDQVASAYFAADRMCYLNADRLDMDDDDFGDPIVLTFASALDHAMGEDGFASRHSPAVQASYRACLKGDDGHTFVDGYSALSPLNYFAQGVAAWMSQSGTVLRPESGPTAVYCSRSRLYDLDRSLYCYLQYLLRDTCSDE